MSNIPADNIIRDVETFKRTLDQFYALSTQIKDVTKKAKAEYKKEMDTIVALKKKVKDELEPALALYMRMNQSPNVVYGGKTFEMTMRKSQKKLSDEDLLKEFEGLNIDNQIILTVAHKRSEEPIYKVKFKEDGGVGHTEEADDIE